MSDSDWKSDLMNQVAELRRIIATKADSSSVEKIIRNQENILQQQKDSEEGSVKSYRRFETDAERTCLECIDNEDFETAFLTVLRYIDDVTSTKAELNTIDGKASKAYVESLFDRLNAMYRQQIAESNAELRNTLETRLENISKQFDFLSQNITKRIETCESDIQNIDLYITNNLSKYVPSISNRTHLKTINVRSKKPFNINKGEKLRSSQLHNSHSGKWRLRKPDTNIDLLSSSITVTRKK